MSQRKFKITFSVDGNCLIAEVTDLANMQPEIINKLNKELIDVMNADEKPCISIDKAAHLLGVDNQSLRVAIANGTCPFGFGGQHQRTGNRFGRVSKLALWNWITKGFE